MYKPSTYVYAICCCIIAATLWGLYWIPLRFLDNSGVSGLWASLLIYSISFICLVPYFFKDLAKLHPSPFLYALLALFAGWTNLAFILALLEGEVIRVMILFYLSPVWATLLAFFVLGEDLKKKNLFTLALAIIGVLFISWRPEIQFRQSFSLADFYAISSGFAFAVTNILVRKIGDTTHSIKMGSAWLGVIVLAVLGLLLKQDVLPLITLSNLWLILVLGFPLMLIMTWTAQYGVTHLPIYLSSVLFLFEIIVGAISAVMLANESISAIQFVGVMMILSAGLINTMAPIKK